MIAILCLIACTAQTEEAVPLAPEVIETNGGSWRLSLEPDPDPPTAGEAALIVGVSGVDSGVAEVAAVVELVPWMPEHSHGSSGEAAITDTGDHSYTVRWAYTMPGYWELTITLDDGESAVVGYEVQ